MKINNRENIETPIIKGSFYFLVIFFLTNLVLSPSTFAISQDYRYTPSVHMKHFSLADGLSQNTGADIIQDSEGYIWIATDDGINRFDGTEFKQFRQEHGNPNSLHENGVISLMEEPGKGIWIGTLSGPSFYEFSSGKFINYSKNLPKLKTYVLGFSMTDDNIIWLATINGLFYLDRKIESNFIPFTSPDGQVISSQVTAFSQSEDHLYVATDYCVYQIKPTDFSAINICSDELLAQLKFRHIVVINLIDDSLWIGTDDGLYKYGIINREVVRFAYDKDNQNSISNNFILDIVADKKGALWIATSGGLNEFNLENKKNTRYKKEIYPDNGLASNDLISLFIDKQDLIWIGTYGAGINLFDPNQKKFEHLFNKSDASNVGNSNLVHGIEKDHHNTLWLAATGNGLINYDLMTGNIEKVLKNKDAEDATHVYSLFIDSDNRLWAGGLSQLLLIDVNSKLKIKTDFYIDGVPNSNLIRVNQVYQFSNGDIWLVSALGIYKVLREGSEQGQLSIWLESKSKQLPKSYTERDSNVLIIMEDQSGNLWAGGDSGLLYYSLSKKKWFHFLYDENNQQSLSNDSVQDIYQDSNGFIWIATSNGLNRIVPSEFNKDSFYFDRITTQDGLANSTINGILEDDRQQLWLSTNLGLVKYLAKDTSIRNYRQSEGLSSDEFNVRSTFKDDEGRLYFGSINGVTLINPEESLLDIDATNMKFSDVQVGTRKINTYQLERAVFPKVIQYEDEAIIKVSITNIDFRKNDNQRYRYRLLGLDSTWNYLGKNNEVFLTGLHEGEYQLEVQTQLPNQQWSERHKKLTIFVKTNFWESRLGLLLFRLIVGFMFLMVVALIIQYYRKKLRNVINIKELETLRRKEMRMNNDSLTSQLNRTERQVVSLTDSLTKLQEKLAYKRYWDVVTGFYKITYLEHIDDRKFSDEMLKNSNRLKKHQSLCVLELDNITDIYDEFGAIAVERFIGEISKTIKDVCESSFQIFKIDSDKFLILSNHIDYQDFERIVTRLKNTITRTEYEMANGITRTTNVSLTLCDASKVKLVEKIDFMSLVNFLISTSSELTTGEKRNDLRLIASSLLSEYLRDLGNYQLNEMLQSKLIDLQLI